MTDSKNSPKISSISWGTVRVEGSKRDFKDVKLYPGGAREWDWKETGTSHQPGVQPADVEELLEHGAQHIVLSKGMHQRLQVRSETLDRLKNAGVEFDVMETNEAVKRYNELAANVPVGALIHSTC